METTMLITIVLAVPLIVAIACIIKITYCHINKSADNAKNEIKYMSDNEVNTSKEVNYPRL